MNWSAAGRGVLSPVHETTSVPAFRRSFPGEYSGGYRAGSTLLYVVDSAGGKVSHIRVFAEMGKGTEDGVRCYAPNGDLIGKIHLPETPGNLVFGGAKRNRLMVCASTSIYSVYLNDTGAQTP